MWCRSKSAFFSHRPIRIADNFAANITNQLEYGSESTLAAYANNQKRYAFEGLWCESDKDC